ncbi:MAG: zinc ribbon domain-containing protein [Bacteroidota bacterium]
MPTYDYQCKECGHLFEEFQSMSSDLLLVCPKCGKPTLKRQMSGGTGMIFKGSGYYLTDYKKGGTSETPAKPKEKETKTETKPESKPTTESTTSPPKKND